MHVKKNITPNILKYVLIQLVKRLECYDKTKKSIIEIAL